MASKRGKFDLKNVPLRSFNLRSQSVANKISLKEKLTAELALVRSAINKIKDDIPRTERCCKRASTNTHPSKQQQVSSSRKRKSSEITQGQLHFHVSNIDSKKSISTQGKRHCFNSNVLVSVGDAHKRNIQPMTQLKSSCDVGQKGFDKSFCKKELTPTKALRVAKLKSRFTDTIVKAQLELQNIGEKQRAFRMQREKEKLAKAYEREKIRIEVQVKAVAAQKAKSELKMKIKKEREASRLALEKIPVPANDDLEEGKIRI